MGLLCVCFLLGGFAGGGDSGGSFFFFFWLIVAWVVGLWWLWYGW